MASCGRLEIGLLSILESFGRPIDKRPQVTNLPHICGEAALCHPGSYCNGGTGFQPVFGCSEATR